MRSPVPIFKFIGTISLGLLTGVSYTLSTQSLPSLLTLPSAKPAAYTLRQTTQLSTRHIRALAAVSSISLALAYALSAPRVRHPYLLWTAAVAAGGGAVDLAVSSSLSTAKGGRRIAVDGEEDLEESLNGEEVERKTRQLQWLEFVRMGVSGIGFAMGVVGIWGDGA